MIRKLAVLGVVFAWIGVVAAPAQAVPLYSVPELCEDPDSNWDVYNFADSAQNWTWTFNGDSGPCINGHGGNDTLKDANGFQTMMMGLGGNGNDTMRGYDGFDAINGGAGYDTIYGGTGDDRLYGDTWDDTIEGQDGADNLFGGGFCNETDYWGFLFIEPGTWKDITDTPCGWGGADILRGGAGADWIWESNSDSVGDNSVDTIDGGAGNDICIAETIDNVTNCETVNIVS